MDAMQSLKSNINALSSKKVAIVQSNYIPWKGYFDLINSVDEFILFDDVQYTKRDWRNRNLIKAAQPLWLTIPVQVKGKYEQKIKDVIVSDASWANLHWKTIRQSYARAKGFREVEDFLSNLYKNANQSKLSDINFYFLEAICRFLGIETKLKFSMDYEVIDGKSERLLHLCKQAGATVYLSGPAAKEYMDESLFENQGVRVEYMDYSGYQEYSQAHPPFVHHVSIIDLLCNNGNASSQLLKTEILPKRTLTEDNSVGSMKAITHF